MAGFYIHIPFCSKVCYYCDFHFTASLKNKDLLIQYIEKEIIKRAENWQNHFIDTIYFGGGTPSILSISEISRLLKLIGKYYNTSLSPEVTFEANPDDLSVEYLHDLKNYTSINRLSIGVQSFNDTVLSFLNRRHNKVDAFNSVLNAKKVGINNISIDLIYGIPGLSEHEWEYSLSQFMLLEIPHLAAYHLTIEPKTVFGVWHKKNKITPVNESTSTQQYQILNSYLKKNDYIHYEISNFAKEGFYSKHNSNYWRNIPYIGVGPSAHSFDGQTRRWNIANNTKYIEMFQSDNLYFETETLTFNDKFNDYLLTSLRSVWGVDYNYICSAFGFNYQNHLVKILNKKINQKYINHTQNGFSLNEKGWFISDLIIQDFFYLD